MWISFPFYHGQLVGWQTTRDGILYEVLPCNGRPGYEVHVNESWCGETFDTVAEAKAWVDSTDPLMDSRTWYRVEHTPAPEDVAVEVLTFSGDKRMLIWSNGLWWLPDKSMYVYFVPEYWSYPA